MASVAPESGKIKIFRTQAAFESWMRKNHAREREVWLRICKTSSAVRSITIAEALDVVLCWGWIDVRGKLPHWSICWNAVKHLTRSVAEVACSREDGETVAPARSGVAYWRHIAFG